MVLKIEGLDLPTTLSLSYHNYWCKGHISREGGHVGKLNLALCRYANPVLSCWSLLTAGSKLGSSTGHARREDQSLHECNGLRMAIIADSVYSCEAVSGWLIRWTVQLYSENCYLPTDIWSLTLTVGQFTSWLIRLFLIIQTLHLLQSNALRIQEVSQRLTR